MKELVLSVLSRGYSHVVQKDSKRQYGRLEVCFEPEDYFIWKSQPLLLRLSSSGRLLSGVEPKPPKTYSTRRGPLILYSEEFASSFPQPYKVNRKEQTFRASRQEAEFEFCSLRDLTEATLVYFKKQAKMKCHSSITQPMLPDPKSGLKHVQAHHRPGDERSYPNQTTGEGKEVHAFFRRQGNILYPRLEQERYQPRFLCFPRPYRPSLVPPPLVTPWSALRSSENRPHMAAATCKPTDTDECSITGDRKTNLKTELVTPKIHIIPNPEFDAEEEHTGQPEDYTTVAEHLTDYPKELNCQWKQNAIETGGGKGEYAPRPAYTNIFLGGSHLSKVPNERRQAQGGWRPKPVNQRDLHLPPIKQAPLADTKSKDHKEQGLKAENKTQESQKEPILRLPDIHQPEIRTEAAAFKPTEKSVLKKVLVLLPGPLEQDGLSCLPEEKEDIKEVLYGDMGFSEVESIRKEENRPFEHEYRLKPTQPENLIRFELEEDKEHQTSMGSMPSFLSRRGLGKQCSMARYRQDQRDSMNQSEPQPAIIRGSLPLELRECQKEGLLGTLIMGPAGEIICLSFWDSLADTEDHPDLEDAITEHVVRVLSSEDVLEESQTSSDQIEEQAKKTGEMNDREVTAKQGHKKQTSTKSEVLNQSMEKIKNDTENHLDSRGDDIMQQTGGRMQGPQPKAKRRSGSSDRPKTDSSTSKTVVSTPRAADEQIDKTKSKSTVNSKKAGKLDTEDNPHIGNVKKQKFEQHANADTFISAAEKTGKTNEDKVDVESQDTRFSGETDCVPTQRKSINVGAEKAKSTKTQITMENVKKKSKGQAAFVVGKPKQSQEVPQNKKRKYSSEMHKKANRFSNMSGNKSADDHSRSSTEYNTDHMKNSEALTIQKKQERGQSPDTKQNYTYYEKNDVGLESERVAVSREDDGAEETGQVFINDCPKSNLSAVSSRSHTAKSSSTSTWSIRRSSVSSDTGVYSPVQLNLFPRRGVPTHHPAPNPDKPESTAEAQSKATAINHRESRLAAALAAKAERHRMEVEKRRKQKEEGKEEVRKRQENKEQTEERMRLELEVERSQRTQQARLRKLKEEEEKQRQAEREKEGQKSEQEDMEKGRRRQEEVRNRKRYQERLQKERQEQEIRRAVELKRQHEEEKTRKEDEYRRLQEMDETEREEYLRRQWEEREEMRRAAEEKKRAKEEADMWYEEFKRQRAELEQDLQFHRGLFVETEGLKQKQTISRPWVFSYFTKLGLATSEMFEEKNNITEPH